MRWSLIGLLSLFFILVGGDSLYAQTNPVQAEVVDGSVELTWTGTKQVVCEYLIFRKQRSRYTLLVQGLSDTNYTDEDVTAGLAYSYLVIYKHGSRCRAGYIGRVLASIPVGVAPIPIATPIPISTPMPTPTPVPVVNPWLYEELSMPQHMASVSWYWDCNEIRSSVEVRFTIHNDPGEDYGLYFMIANGDIGGVGYYAGLQTDVYREGYGHVGKGAIFSRWDTRDLANVRYDSDSGFAQSSGHEGNFVGVRRLFDWDAGDYVFRIEQEEFAADGIWYKATVIDEDSGMSYWIGSMKFSYIKGFAHIREDMYSTIEIYRGNNVRPVDIPEWHVSIVPPVGSDYARGYYNGFGVYGDKKYNSDVSYSRGRVDIRVGGQTERDNEAGRIDW